MKLFNFALRGFTTKQVQPMLKQSELIMKKNHSYQGSASKFGQGSTFNFNLTTYYQLPVLERLQLD